jgi:hypothetical protein
MEGKNAVDLDNPVGSEVPALCTEIAKRLESQFPHLGDDEVRHAVCRAQESFTDAKVRLYLPLLIERCARESLTRLALRPREMQAEHASGPDSVVSWPADVGNEA